MRKTSAAILTAAALAGGCIAPRERVAGGGAAPRPGEWSALELAVSSGSASGVVLRQLPDTLYYADLGPDAIDVSSYPDQQQENYKIFTRACGECHTLARAVNSPTRRRWYWRFHLARMRLHSQGRLRPITAAERDAILDFLDYDSSIRKVQRRAEFEALTEELERRFDPIYQRLLQGLR